MKTYRDRHGRVRHYFHRRSQRDVALPGPVGSEQFMRAYQSAFGTPPKPISPHASGTLAKLVEDYYRSIQFANLKPSSQSLYRNMSILLLNVMGTASCAICRATKFERS